jgi:hypothetical protein
MYIFDADVETLRTMLNDDPEVAFIVADDAGRWKAVQSVPVLEKGRHAIWHVPSGPLPLLAAAHGDPDGDIVDPWRGWAERRAGADPSAPYFGPGHPGIFWLNLRIGLKANEDFVGLSSFEWIGHRYEALGRAIEESTDRWWKRLGATIRRLSKKVPRGGPTGPFKPEIYALPGAIRAFEDGTQAADNP